MSQLAKHRLIFKFLILGALVSCLTILSTSVGRTLLSSSKDREVSSRSIDPQAVKNKHPFAVTDARIPMTQEPRNSQAQDDHRQLVDAVRKGGLREAAKIKGSYVITRNASWDAVFSDIESLTSHSEMVVVGVPIESSAHISTEGNTVLTDFRVSITEVLKGEASPGGVVTVSALGGLVRFDDGTSVEVRTPDLQIQKGKSYAFFLTEKDQLNAFHITGGAQGVFELRHDGKGIVPQGRQTDLVVGKYKGQSVESFLQEAHVAVEKWPTGRKCCR